MPGPDHPTPAEFQILSHAGLAVRVGGFELLVDPWLVGSTYWRSWWNYPPVDPALVATLRPDAIYLTHIHWDHFQGVSLRRFPRSTPIYVPASGSDRMVRDLRSMGFGDVREMSLGRRTRLADGLTITSYPFGVFLDSALVIEAGGTTILDANDAKVMGRPLAHLLSRHPPIDFALRSHSSANSRLCYEIIGRPEAPLDDEGRYLRSFEAFAVRSGARYAIPFASNHCHLHPDTWRFNAHVQTPERVAAHVRASGRERPEVVVMVSGDSWSGEHGFRISGEDWFGRREERLDAYREARAPALARSAEREARAVVTRDEVATYFARLHAASPWAWLRLLRSRPFAYALTAGERRFAFEVDVGRGRVTSIDAVTDARHPRQIHTSAWVFKR